MDLFGSATLRAWSARVGVLSLLTAVFFLPRLAHAQASLYALGTASDLQAGPGGSFLYGGTLGLLVDGPVLLGHAALSADVQTRYVDKNGERLVSLNVGPRFSFQIKKLKLVPYAGFLVGFGRYRDSTAVGALTTTDNEWQVNMGAARQLSPRLDLDVDYGYSQYGAENGKYNPKNFSAGIIFHFVKR